MKPEIPKPSESVAMHRLHQKYLAYRLQNHACVHWDLPPGYEFRLWKPSPFQIVPPTFSIRFAAWWFFHFTRLMRSGDYCVLLILHNGSVVHRTCLVPKYFRWPFMADGDVQISSAWTYPEHRGHGLAKAAICHLAEFIDTRQRTLWYLTRPDNPESISVCRACGFEFVMPLRRAKRFGSLLLGKFEPLPIDASAPQDSLRHE